MDGASIKAPRIGLCSNNIKINKSQIDSNFKGCLPDSGKGFFQRRAGCSGAGASHGGYGGYGSASSNDKSNIKKCQNVFPVPYWEGRESRYDGSGGSSGNVDAKITNKK